MKITGLAVLMSVALLCVAAPVVPEQVKTAPVKTPPASPVKRNRTPRKAAKPAAKRRQAPQKVMISKFNPDAKDATPALNKALRSGARRIIFDRPGTYFLRPVTVRSYLTIILRPGVKLETLPPHPDKNGKIDISERFVVPVGDQKYVLYIETLTSRHGMNNEGVSVIAATTYDHFDQLDYGWNGAADDSSAVAGKSFVKN